jgi:hypothetical protein
MCGSRAGAPAGLKKSMEYWKGLYEAAAATSAQVMGCLREAVPKND